MPATHPVSSVSATLYFVPGTSVIFASGSVTVTVAVVVMQKNVLPSARKARTFALVLGCHIIGAHAECGGNCFCSPLATTAFQHRSKSAARELDPVTGLLDG